MKEFIKLTEEFAKRIIEIEDKRKKIAELLRKLDSVNLEDTLEEKIIIPTEKTKLNLKIAGVDGGLVKKSLHGLDLMLLRAIGVLFSYKEDKLEKVEYYPEALPSPIPRIVFDPFSDLEFEINSSMERQAIEIDTASQVIEKFDPDILLLDGSIVPHYTERPSENSLLFPTYHKMIDSYKKLFEKAKDKTILAGVIEDSRGKRFCEIVNQILSNKIDIETKILLEKTKDTNLLTYGLNLSERTFVFRYSSEPEEHPVLKEFGLFANFISTFYLKTAEFDRPIRVDFLAEKDFVKIANKLSSVLLALAGHAGYGIPSVLIEADQRARLTEKDLELFYLDLISKAGNLPGLFGLRREQRPF